MGPDLDIDIEFSALLLGQLLDKPVFHDDKLILKWDVSLLAHIKGNNQSLDFIVIGFEIFQGDVVKGIQNFVVFWSVLHKLLQGFSIVLLVHFVLTLPGERTGDRHVEMSIAGTGNYVADCSGELIGLQYFIALLHIVIINLTICDKDHLLQLLVHDLPCHYFGRCSPLALPAFYLKLHFLLVYFVDARVPLIVQIGLIGMKVEDFLDGIPVVFATARGPTDVYHKGKFVSLLIHIKSFINNHQVDTYTCPPYHFLYLCSDMSS